jgi:hypothetical protein
MDLENQAIKEAVYLLIPEREHGGCGALGNV